MAYNPDTPSIISGPLSRMPSDSFTDYERVKIGSALFHLPYQAIPRVPEGTVVTLRLTNQNQPDLWELPNNKTAAALHLTKSELLTWMNQHQSDPDTLSDDLFSTAFSLPILSHSSVFHLLQNDKHDIPYVDLAEYPCTYNGPKRNEMRQEIFNDTVLNAYLYRYGWANAHLILRERYHLDIAQAQTFLQHLDLSLDWLKQYPYLGAYALQSENLNFTTLDTIAAYHGSGASNPNRIYAALFWQIQNRVLQQGQLIFNPEKIISATEKTLRDSAIADPHSIFASQDLSGSYHALLEKAWEDMLQTNYVWEKVGDKGPYGSISRLYSTIKLAGKTAYTLTHHDAYSALPLNSKIFKALPSLTTQQRAAITSMTSNPLTVITGGPGHGKTRLLAVTALAAATAHHNPGEPALWVCSPTSRAAVRAKDAMIALADSLGIDAKDVLPHVHFKTLHKALNATPTTQGKIDEIALPPMLLIDEASMLDATLAFPLFKAALNRNSRVTLIGDPCQLPPVGLGHVLEKLLTIQQATKSQAHIYELTTDYRRIHNPISPALDALRQAILLQDGLSLVPTEQYLDKSERNAQILQYLTTAIDALKTAETIQWDHAVASNQIESAVMGALHTIQQNYVDDSFLVLTPYRAARTFNVVNLNHKIHSRITHSPDLVPGEPVIIRQNNDYPLRQSDKKIYVPNGTPALVSMVNAHDVTLIIDNPESPTGESEIVMPNAAFESTFELGYVNTIHAAQGGEASHIILLGNPSDAQKGHENAIQWTPRMLYTALSRVKDLSADQLGTIHILGDITADTLSKWDGPNQASTTFLKGWKELEKDS